MNIKLISVLILSIHMAACGVVYNDLEWVKARSQSYYAQGDFKIVRYQGYSIARQGRCYWYVLEKDNTIYESCLLKWGDELHEYNFRAVNAIEGTKP